MTASNDAYVRRPRLLDLFCGAGGAAMGYHRAGFEVVGVDIKPQPHYPFEFVQCDALSGSLAGFDAIHASPPCQFATTLRALHPSKEYVNLIPQTKALLEASGLPYVIENVPQAAAWLAEPITLCGTMFGLGIEGAELRRHRVFEIHPRLYSLSPPCVHGLRHHTIGVYGGGGADPRPTHRGPRPRTVAVYGNAGGTSRRRAAAGKGSPQQHTVAERRVAMDIDWMTCDELDQAIPPAYTEWIGRQLLAALEVRVA